MAKTWIKYTLLVALVLDIIYRQNTRWDRTKLTPISIFEQTRRDFFASPPPSSPVPADNIASASCPHLTKVQSNSPLLEAKNPSGLPIRNDIELTIGDHPALLYEVLIAADSIDYVYEAVILDSGKVLLTYRACPGTDATTFVGDLNQLIKTQSSRR